MTTTQKESLPSANRHLSEACKKMTSLWFPVHPEHLAKIHAGLKNGAYDLDIDFLISEIQTDIALFTYALKEARKILGKAHEDLSPFELLQRVGLQNLKKIISVSPESISHFKLENADELQIVRLREAVVSTSAAEVIAEHKNVPNNLGYSTEVIKQLGLTLISWNYPNEYKKAMAAYKDGADLDIELTKAIGFSASLFGIAIARQWGLCAELRHALGDKHNGNKKSDAYKTAETLSKICEVGEALARANNPEHHPEPVKDWENAKKDIEEVLGSKGMSIIEDHVQDYCKLYTELSPTHFSEKIEFSSPVDLELDKTDKRYIQNKHIKFCPTEAQEALKSLYNSLSSDPKSRQTSIVHIANTICPMVGFNAGCIFLLDPEKMVLSPRFMIGKVAAKTFKSYHAMSLSTRNPDPITSAYHCNTPIVQGNNALSPLGSASLSIVLGQQQRIGVLYLEPSQELLRHQDSSVLPRFRAISQSFHDCLSLK